MSEQLFDEIQQFLDDGGEPAEPSHEEQLMAAMAQFAEAMRPHIEAAVEAIQEIADIIIKAVRAFMQQVTQWAGVVVIGLRRAQLRQRLEQMRLPRWLATWLVVWWPERWLPQLSYDTA